MSVYNKYILQFLKQNFISDSQTCVCKFLIFFIKLLFISTKFKIKVIVKN